MTKEKREFLDGLDRTIFPSCEYKSLTGFLIEGFVGSGELPIKSYNKIFILPPWEDIYIADNERYENYEQAKLIYNHLVETYEKYGYNLIEVPKDTVDNRILFILEQI